jgi:hypothetical protein
LAFELERKLGSEWELKKAEELGAELEQNSVQCLASVSERHLGFEWEQ